MFLPKELICQKNLLPKELVAKITCFLNLAPYYHYHVAKIIHVLDSLFISTSFGRPLRGRLLRVTFLQNLMGAAVLQHHRMHVVGGGLWISVQMNNCYIYFVVGKLHVQVACGFEILVSRSQNFRVHNVGCSRQLLQNLYCCICSV